MDSWSIFMDGFLVPQVDQQAQGIFLSMQTEPFGPFEAVLRAVTYARVFMRGLLTDVNVKNSIDALLC